MPSEVDMLREFADVQRLDIGAKFYKVDLHFHTPASEDARGRNRYGFNPYSRKYPRRPDAEAYLEGVRTVRSEIAAGARRTAQKVVTRFLQEELSLVAITDHNSLGTIWTDSESGKAMDLAAPTWYELIDDAAQKANRDAGRTVLTILPGVEISTTGVHILAIFPPQRPRRKIHFIICDLLNEIGFEIEEWGKNPKVGSASVTDTIDAVVKHGGIAIPAHIDGSSQALLDLYPTNSGAMKDVLGNRALSAVEIVEPDLFTKRDRKLRKPLSRWVAGLRQKKGLPPFAYFQGSDAHDLRTIGKRLTYVKMTEPTFSGLQTAIKMPASRVRISDLYQPVAQGLFVYGMALNNKYYGKRFLRFNRHLNCITGRKGVGKSGICDLMQAAAHPEAPLEKGRITLFVEKITDGNSRFFAFSRSSREKDANFAEIDPEARTAQVLELQQSRALGLVPKFYRARKIQEIILSPDRLHDFMVRHFGPPTEQNAGKFNRLFAIESFLEEAKPLLSTKLRQGRYRLRINVNWPDGRAKMTDVFKLSYSMRKTAMMCIIIIMGESGPVIIDAPETDFDNADVIRFLVPVIKQYKDQQQIILFSNSPLFAVNTDPDDYFLLDAKGTKFKNITSGFAIDDEEQRPLLLDIMEGGLKSFRKRAVRYDL